MFSDAYSFVAHKWLQDWSIVEHSDVWFTGLDGRVTIGTAEGLSDWVHSYLLFAVLNDKIYPSF